MKFESVSKSVLPGRYSVGQNLYLNVARGGSKSWVFMSRSCGELGLGSATGAGSAVIVSKADAIAKAAEIRVQLAKGIDPRAAKREAAREMVTFGDLFEELITIKRAEWKAGSGTEDQWRSQMTLHCSRLLTMRPAEVVTEVLVDVLREPWVEVPKTADHLRMRIEGVLNLAKVKGLVSGENPARYAGNLEILLGKKHTRADAENHAALPYGQVPAIVAQLAGYSGMAARALLFTILTASRSDEVISMRWAELDLDRALWSVPGERMKAGKDHVVPLSRQAVELLRSIARQPGNEFVFAGQKRGESISRCAMRDVVNDQLKLKGVATVHGFRSTFRDWAGDKGYSRELAEQQLAHTIGGVEGAYRRGTALDLRAGLVQDWADFAFGAELSQKEAA